MVSKIMIYDKVDSFFDIYIFEKSYKYEDIEKVVNEHKQKYIGLWTMESIRNEIESKFEVKEIISCDYVLEV